MLLWQGDAEDQVNFILPNSVGKRSPHADRCCRTGVLGSVATAVCCLTPLLDFLLGLVGLSFLTPYLDYLLVPLFIVFVIVGLYGRMQGGKLIRRK
jgi:mercuric ion transport protein